MLFFQPHFIFWFLQLDFLWLLQLHFICGSWNSTSFAVLLIPLHCNYTSFAVLATAASFVFVTTPLYLWFLQLQFICVVLPTPHNLWLLQLHFICVVLATPLYLRFLQLHFIFVVPPTPPNLWLLQLQFIREVLATPLNLICGSLNPNLFVCYYKSTLSVVIATPVYFSHCTIYIFFSTQGHYINH